MSYDVDQVLGLDAPERPVIPRRRNQPLIVPPGGGDLVPYLRPSTIGKILEDQTNLVKWKLRTALRGAQHPDLAVRITAVADPDSKAGKDELNAIAEQAHDAGGGNAKSRLGTALHAFTQRLDEGQRIQPPADYVGDVNAYIGLTRGAITWLDIERFVVCDEPFAEFGIGLAGTPDGIGRLEVDLLFGDIVVPAGRVVIVDKKTNQSLDWSKISIPAQLASYAHGQYYDPTTGARTPIDGVDLNHGIVIHMPSGAGLARWYHADLVAGWHAVRAALGVRAMRNSCRTWLIGDGTARTSAPAEPAPPSPAGGETSVVARATTPDPPAGPTPPPGPFIVDPTLLDPNTGELFDDNPPARLIRLLTHLGHHVPAVLPPESVIASLLAHWTMLLEDRAAGRREATGVIEAEMTQRLHDHLGAPNPPPATDPEPSRQAPAPICADDLARALAEADSIERLRELWRTYQLDGAMMSLLYARRNVLAGGLVRGGEDP